MQQDSPGHHGGDATERPTPQQPEQPADRPADQAAEQPLPEDAQGPAAAPADDGAAAGAPGMEQPRLFTKDFLLAIVVNVILALVFYMLITGMAVYAVEEFQAGQTAAGFAASAFVIGALASRFAAGKYVDFLGRRRTILVCLFVYVLAGLAYLWVDSYEALIALRVIHGISFGFGQTALNAAVFALIPAGRRGEGAGYYMLAVALPPAIGPMLTLQLTQHLGFWAMFVCTSVISVIGLVAALVIRLPAPENVPRRWRDRLRLRPADIIEPRAFALASIAMLLGFSFASIMTFLNGFARSEGMITAASMFFVIYAVAVLVTRLFAGKIQDRFGDNVVVYPTIVLYAVALGLLAWSPNQATILIAGVLAGLGFGALLPAFQATIASMLPTTRTSIGISTFFILLDTGFGLSPLVLGPLVEHGSYRIMFGACAVIVALTLVLYWMLHGRFSVKQGESRRPRRS
ncbi:MFS transporter [Nesterenkonia xinjiangensis]|uniref:MFS family permease n=1 Tax=Nesterenkonia xinjiangensis TaxID=225327 RepID=A0A7Z0KAX9_9MICC|nr:MFS family permease [Nesterenkonia xinjiangensis]